MGSTDDSVLPLNFTPCKLHGTGSPEVPLAMKFAHLSMLPLAAVLVLPAVAQEPDAAPANQPAQQQTQQTQTDQQVAAQPQHEPLTTERREGFWGRLNPFARKKYVERQLEPVRGRVNELDELTHQNANQIRDVDARAQQGIQQANTMANQADQKATEAGSRAQQAQQTASMAATKVQSVEQAIGNLDQYRPMIETEIRFRPGQLALSSRAKEALDEIAAPLKGQNGYIVEVQGFSSGSGRAALENSQRLADSVVRYLVLNHDVPVYRIFVVGMGNALRPAAEGEARRTVGGRVELSVLKNSISDMRAQSQSYAPANQNGVQPQQNQQPQTGGAVGSQPQSGTESSQPAGISQPQSQEPPR